MVTDKVPYPVQLQGVRTVRNVESLRCPVANGTGGGRLYLLRIPELVCCIWLTSHQRFKGSSESWRTACNRGVHVVGGSACCRAIVGKNSFVRGAGIEVRKAPTPAYTELLEKCELLFEESSRRDARKTEGALIWTCQAITAPFTGKVAAVTGKVPKRRSV